MTTTSNERPKQPTGNIDPIALMRIKNLQLRAKAVVDGFFNGLHRSPLHGFSVEFSEYRPYSEGDDPKSLDWRLFARSDRYYVKKFEDETNRRCYMVVDQSRSMGFGSLGFQKVEYARTLAATLAYYFTMQRDAVGLLTFEADISDYVPARHRPGQLQRILGGLQKPIAGAATDLEKPLEHLADIVSQRSIFLLISDFLVPLEQLKSRFSFLRARRHEVVALRILDPSEVELQGKQPQTFVDLETGKKVFVDPQQAAASYRKRFLEHESQLTTMLGSLGISLTTLLTNEPLDRALYDLLSIESNRRVRGRASSSR